MNKSKKLVRLYTKKHEHMHTDTNLIGLLLVKICAM